MDDRSIILFDGVCNLCNGWVNFVIDHDPEGQFVFAALQSNEAEVVLDELRKQNDFDSIVLVDEGRVFEKSDAVLRIAGRLESGWRHLKLFRWVPRFARDAVYDLVAVNRYNWFGKRDSCRIPTPDLASRFLQKGDVSSTDT